MIAKVRVELFVSLNGSSVSGVTVCYSGRSSGVSSYVVVRRCRRRQIECPEVVVVVNWSWSSCSSSSCCSSLSSCFLD